MQADCPHEVCCPACLVALRLMFSAVGDPVTILHCSLPCTALLCTAPSCKAYCSYTAERRLLFSQGVTLHVQPDGRTWRKLGMLSGGQRSLATLALSFALQVRLVGLDRLLSCHTGFYKVTSIHVQTVVLACRLQLNLCCGCATRSCFACLAAAATATAALADVVPVSLLLF